ncbi:MAG: HsdM family class I SAM-dependent methyltransferase [Betaproteobacteria bacterium]
MLLNGGQGNFCLRVESADGEHDDLRSLAWSADVGHFVVSSRESIEVVRWNDPLQATERFSATAVSQRLEEFHQYLERKDPPRTRSVIQHATNVFSGLWNALQVEKGESAVRAFLCLLACTHDDVELTSLDAAAWGISVESVSIARTLRPEDWEDLRRLLVHPSVQAGLKPHVDLLLRHASGLLFQEAHHLAHVPFQSRLAGIVDLQVRHARQAKGGSGVFFTPPALTRTIVEIAVQNLDLTVPRLVAFDPACGSAEFLREFLRLVRLKNYRGEVHLVGWDISSIAADISRFVLQREVVNTAGSGNTTFEVKNFDSLSELAWPQNSSVVLTNPPFISWDLMTEVQRAQVMSALGELGKKKPNMASAFLLRAMRALSNDGVLGSVVPSSFISAESASAVRDQLASALNPVLIAKLGSQMVFHNAVVDAGLYISTRRQRVEPPVAVWADFKPASIGAALRGLRKQLAIGPITGPKVEANYSIYPAPSLGSEGRSWAPTSFESYAALAQLERFNKVGDLFDVKQGVRMGHDLFIVPAEYYSQLQKREQAYFRPAVMNRSVINGQLLPLFYIFYPNTAGLDQISSEKALASAVPDFYADFLKPDKEALAKRARIQPGTWWRLMEHRAWLQKPTAKIVSTYFGDVGSFAFDVEGNYVPVVGNGWLPQPRTRAKGKDHGLPRNVWLAYLAILNSKFFSILLSGVSHHVGGGQWDLSKRFIGNVPIPDLTSSGFDPYVLSRLAKIGVQFTNGVEAVPSDLEDTVRVAYGV